MALDGSAVIGYAVDAPRVALGGFGVAHSAPFNCRRCGAWSLLCGRGGHDHEPGLQQEHLKCIMCVSLLFLFFFFTFLQGSDDAHVLSTQIQEGVSVRGQLNQLLGGILEHQVLGRGVGLRGEEVEVLKRHHEETLPSVSLHLQ